MGDLATLTLLADLGDSLASFVSVFLWVYTLLLFAYILTHLINHAVGIVSLDALEAGDLIKAGRLFSGLTDRWTEVRSNEVVN